MAKMPERIGRYKITGKLGEGSMAVVYKAFDPRIGRELAIKVLHEKHYTDQEYRTRFLREAKAAGNLKHPNIVTIYDVGQADDDLYIVMELLEGVPLDEALEEQGSFPEEIVARIGIQLAEALDYAHTRGIVHRDIKPSNMIYLSDESTVKITDFGIAHVEDLSRTHKTKMGDVLGTPHYMSPEQVNGKTVDGRSDLFSVGIVLYHLLCGHTPFDADTIIKLMIQITHSNHVPLKTRLPGLYAPLSNIIDGLLQKSPAARMQTGQELAAALRPVLKHFEERADETDHRVFPLRVRWAVCMAAIVAGVMIVGGYLLYNQQAESMRRLVLNYGASLAKFIAMESAEPILIRDWVAIEVFVQEARRNQELADLTIVDFAGVVRGSTDATMLGMPYSKGGSLVQLTLLDSTVIYEGPSAQGDAYFFHTPVTFQGREIGQVQLGLPQASLQKVTTLTIALMSVLMLVTVAAVALIGYWLAKRVSRPIAVLRNGFHQVRQGVYSHRIDERRKDEFGQLFAAFDDMVASIQEDAGRQDRNNGAAEARAETVHGDKARATSPGDSNNDTKAHERSGSGGQDKPTRLAATQLRQ